VNKNIYDTGEWPKDFNDITMTALKKKKKATKCRTNAHTLKVAVRILRRRTERKFGGVLGEDHIGFRGGKEIGMQLVYSE
jgi:hypothetical protein